MRYFITIIFIFWSIAIFAQVPQAFNYQGVARNLSGDPIPNKNIGLRIAILQTSTSGTEVYTETHQTMTTNLGLFNLSIGKGLPVNGYFEDIEWGSDSYFIQIELDENGGNDYHLIGTSELLSVPYALYAGNGSLWKNFDQGIIFEDTYLDDSNLSSPLTAELFNNSNDPRAYSRFRVVSGTNETSYGGVLAYFPTNFYNPSFANFTEVASYKKTNGLMLRTSADLGVIKFLTQHDKERMRITHDGLVGIGAIDPKSKLQIANGDIYIESMDRGVIMKSPDGQCWRMTVSNSGQPEFNSVSCPN